MPCSGCTDEARCDQLGLCQLFSFAAFPRRQERTGALAVVILDKDGEPSSRAHLVGSHEAASLSASNWDALYPSKAPHRLVSLVPEGGKA